VTVARDLATIGSAPVSAVDADYIRAATLTNIAAGAGDLGSSQKLIDRVTELYAGTPAGDAVGLAMRLHARTQDDFVPSGRSHLGAVTLAAALALADEVGDRLIECLAAGYRTMIALARCYSAEVQHRRYRPTGFFGPFGSTRTATRALGLDDDEATMALGVACITTSGTNQAWISGTDEWLLEVGFASRAGVECAQLARAGARSSPVCFEGDAGWSFAFFDDTAAAQLARSLPAEISIASTVATKPYPVSGIAQPATHLAAQAHGELAGRTPRKITVRMSAAEADYPGSLNRGPFVARGQALMSVAYCVAAALADGLVTLRRLEEPGGLAGLIDIVEIVADPGLEEMATTLVIAADDGEFTFSGHGRDMLFPVWAELDSAAVARRSEAPERLVEAAHRELSRPRPDARVLKDLLLHAG
jgi:2-methylcitrate dehydratase PrpD